MTVKSSQDEKIWISVGLSRRETKWKNKEVKWSHLVKRLNETLRTNEKYAEYIKLKPDEQDAIKDVGGFVGGIIQGGRRKKGSVSMRQLVTLDLDESTKDFFEDFLLVFPVEACIYSTHKHSNEKPRHRLVLPLSREVQSDEYEAIARKIAELIDIDQFDPTTFQPERLMYWPSTSKDGDFYFDTNKSGWLDADWVLEQYSDWKDVSQWAYHSKVEQKIRRGIQKQGDPLTKPGVIGVFNRTYDIHEAIAKFLSDVYEPTQAGDRYTYTEGSTSAGVIIYDDVFSFSHHSTDPSSNRLCNAFDLVRIHKFGESDINTPADTPSNKLPSYSEMLQFCSEDPNTKKNLLTDQLKSAQEDFEDLDDSDSIEPGSESLEELDWLKKLEVDKKGNIFPTINNCLLIMEYDKRLTSLFSLNQFTKQIVLKKNLPWRKVTRLTNMMTKADNAGLRNYFERVYKISNKNKLEDGLIITAQKKGFHPVKDYLKSLKWDGQRRLEKLIIDYLGANDSVYVREVTKKTFVAAVARVFEPGVKFDNVLTLQGEEGLGKSEIFRRMAGEWFSDSFGNLQNNSAMEQIQGVWIMEIGELAGLNKSESNTQKHFLSKQEDKFRVAYGETVENFPRECIFVATVNPAMFLKDADGNRRFWVIAVGVYETDLTPFKLKKEIIDQIWAEACYLYGMGEDLFLAPEVEKIARTEQAKYLEYDDRTDVIRKYLEMLVPEEWYEYDTYQRRSSIQGDESMTTGVYQRSKITVLEIWTELFGGHVRDMTHYNVKFIRQAMTNLKDWKPEQIKSKQFGNQRGYRHINSLQRSNWRQILT
jgi:putative DNA primase/helicase